ncbi:MAG: YdcF family protein [Defluviitaleaceae bacterium]|nr:YdcF family protein [Defluviitaleaceae bacterium]
MHMRKMLTVISGILLLHLIYVFFRSGIGSNTFLLNLGLFLGVATYTIFYEQLQKIKWIRYATFIFLIMYMGLGAFAMVYGRWDTVTFQEDVAIVLGTGLRGESPSTTLQHRLDMAVLYHYRNPEALIIVSGGQGSGNVITEALAMARYLEAAGVPPELIIQEDNSHSTYQNMRYSMLILERLFVSDPKVVVITNDFHIYRSMRFTRIVGMDNATSFHGDTPLLALPGALIREVAAIVKMWAIGT